LYDPEPYTVLELIHGSGCDEVWRHATKQLVRKSTTATIIHLSSGRVIDVRTTYRHW